MTPCERSSLSVLQSLHFSRRVTVTALPPKMVDPQEAKDWPVLLSRLRRKQGQFYFSCPDERLGAGQSPHPTIMAGGGKSFVPLACNPRT